MGSIYTRPNSPHLWVKYYVNGRPVRESTGTAKEGEAADFLKRREGAATEAGGAPHAWIASGTRSWPRTSGATTLRRASGARSNRRPGLHTWIVSSPERAS